MKNIYTLLIAMSLGMAAVGWPPSAQAQAPASIADSRVTCNAGGFVTGTIVIRHGASTYSTTFNGTPDSGGNYSYSQSSATVGVVNYLTADNPAVNLQPDSLTLTFTTAYSGSFINAGMDTFGTFTAAFPPAVTTGTASSVTTNAATLGASINPNNDAATAQFQYGTTTSYGSTAAITLAPNNGTSSQNVSVNLTGLLPNTTYHFRAVATNSVGGTVGSDQTFTTPAIPTAPGSLVGVTITAFNTGDPTTNTIVIGTNMFVMLTNANGVFSKTGTHTYTQLTANTGQSVILFDGTTFNMDTVTYTFTTSTSGTYSNARVRNGVPAATRTGTFTLSTVPSAPVIITAPTAQVQPAGGTATFTVAAGVDITGYQWRKNGNPITGETNAILTLNNLVRGSGGVFSVVVSNAGGSTTNSGGLLRVIVPQQLSHQRGGSGQFQLLFSDPDNTVASDLSRFEVHYTTNFIGTSTVWVTNSGNFTLSNGKILFDDLGSASAPRRYYRVIER